MQRVIPADWQESVWDYPRPPRLEKTTQRIVVEFGGKVIADTAEAYRVLETSHPPVYYIPPADIEMECLLPAAGSSFCEWKGTASYYSVRVGDRIAPESAWYYPQPAKEFGPIKGYVAFYAALMDRCTVDGILATPQPGGFYGGWITPEVVGPFKGEPGTWGW